MAFLSTAGRFGPDLDRCRKIQPSPSTYEPVVETIADGTLSRTSSRHGTIGPHPSVSMECSAAAAKLLATVEIPPTSINAQRHKAPSPWDYTPTVRSDFARVFTADDLDAVRKQRVAASKRAAAARFSVEKPKEMEHLALGPGTYEVDKEWNLETIAIPFSFGKAPRCGIVSDLHSDARRLDKYDKRLSVEQRRRSETALLPLRRATPATPIEMAALSKELAKSYAELHHSAARIERKLASPELRMEKFQRDFESFRRRPGSYARSDRSPPPTDMTEQSIAVVSASLPLNETQRQELETLLSRDTNPRGTGHRTRKPTTFGHVKHRDMLTSMTHAGHLSATASDDRLGPGVYETATSTFHTPSHNLLYKAGGIPKRTAKSKRHPGKPVSTSESDDQGPTEIRDNFLALRRGPVLSPHC